MCALSSCRKMAVAHTYDSMPRGFPQQTTRGRARAAPARALRPTGRPSSGTLAGERRKECEGCEQSDALAPVGSSSPCACRTYDAPDSRPREHNAACNARRTRPSIRGTHRPGSLLGGVGRPPAMRARVPDFVSPAYQPSLSRTRGGWARGGHAHATAGESWRGRVEFVEHRQCSSPRTQEVKPTGRVATCFACVTSAAEARGRLRREAAQSRRPERHPGSDCRVPATLALIAEGHNRCWTARARWRARRRRSCTVSLPNLPPTAIPTTLPGGELSACLVLLAARRTGYGAAQLNVGL